MIDDSQASMRRPAGAVPVRPVHEVFCIHSYAGELGPPCGWYGPASEIVRYDAAGARRCPRCGRATLMDIAPPRSAPARKS